MVQAARAAFRFCFVYLGLFCLTTQILGGLFPIPKVDFPGLAALPPVRPVVLWTATHIFRMRQPLAYADTGSGDRMFDWMLAFCILVAATLAAGIWQLLDRRRTDYTTLYRWFRLFIRFALASQMFLYGMAKAIPAQMPFPYLVDLVEPYGHKTPMGILWSFVGASPAYETFTGCAEILGGILLLIPRATMLGALVCLADLTQVFVLNMTYDVPVKLFSFHLILLAAFLLAPDWRRLAGFFLTRRGAPPSTEPPLFHTRRANRIAMAVQFLLAFWIAGVDGYTAWNDWHTYGGGRPQSPFYGIWNVEKLSMDGQLRPPLATDHERWRRAIFDVPDWMTFQRMDDTLANYGAAIDSSHRTLALSRWRDKKWKANFIWQREAPDRLTLDGDMDGHKIRMELQRMDAGKLPLLSRGFHWVQEHPVNQ